MLLPNLSAENFRNYNKLMVALEASIGTLNLQIAICDDRALREKLRQAYEAELQQQDIRTYQIQLQSRAPSLKSELAQLVEAESALQEHQPAVVTVLGADTLLSVKLDAEKSEQEAFFFSLQWTREALREFQFPIVLWLNNLVAARLTERAPDFWSWRGGVVSFEPEAVIAPERSTTRTMTPQSSEVEESENRSIVDLREQIAALESQDPASPLLITLYENLGLQSEREFNYPAAADEFARSYQLAKALGDRAGEATALNRLGNLFRLIGRYNKAEPLLVQALDLRRNLFGEAHLDVATSLNNLALLYDSQGRYAEAEPLYVRALSIREQQLGADHPSVATSLNNLAALYKSQGRYAEAEPLYVRALSIYEQQLGADHPDVATSLNNLAALYKSQGRYAEAELLLVRALSIHEQQLGADHPDVATSLNNLAALYHSQGRYAEAEPLYVRAVEIVQKTLGDDHPNTKLFRKNFRLFVQQIIDEGQTAQLSDHPVTQTLRQELEAK
jgi:tetratricopeptide (TPR) repeat protein